MLKISLSRIYKEFINDVCSYRAAALTFSTLLSLVPLITVSVSVLAFFPQFQLVSVKVENFIFAHLVATSGEAVQTYLQEFAHQAQNLSIIGLLFLLITSIQMMFTIEQSLNAIWQVKKQRPFLKAVFLYLAIIIISPFFLGMSFLISAHLETISLITKPLQFLDLTTPISIVFPYLLSVIMLTLLYFIVPYRKVKFRYCFVSASIIGLLFELAKKIFTLYLTYFPTYHIIYGPLSVIPIFLLWIYFCWVIVLLGAILNRELEEE